MRRRRNRVVLDTPDRQAHREAVADVARLQRKLAEVRAKMAEVQRRSVYKPVFDLAAWVARRPVDIIVDDVAESTCTPGELEAVYRRLLELRLKAPPNVYRSALSRAKGSAESHAPDCPVVPVLYPKEQA